MVYGARYIVGPDVDAVNQGDKCTCIVLDALGLQKVHWCMATSHVLP